MGAGRSRRTGIILIVLILVIVLVAVGGFFLLNGFGGLGGGVAGEALTMPAPTAPPTVNIIVASQDIPRGSLVSAEDVEVMAWPVLEEAPPPLGVLTVEGQGAGVDLAIGRVARQNILAGTPVLDSMLTSSGEASDLGDEGSDAALQVPSGYVALALPITRLSSVAYALREGDHVDVLMSFRFIDVDEDFQTELPNDAIIITDDPELAALGLQELRYPYGREERGLLGATTLIVPGENQPQGIQQTTQLVIDNAIVMRVGTWPISDLNQPIVVTAAPTATPVPEETADNQGVPATPVPAVPPPDIITLAMPRQDALVLKYASELNVAIDLALRSALDDDVEDIQTDPVTLSYIINARNVAPPDKLPVALDPRVDVLESFSTATGQSELEAMPTEEGAQQ
jgi:Flp pilus assembly protein CpaB